MTKYIYARVSTDQQSTDAQLLALADETAVIIQETASGTKSRPALEALIAAIQPGDTVHVVAIDRLGRKVRDVIAKLESILEKGGSIVSLREGKVYEGASGKLIAQLMAAVAEFEREAIVERVKSGLANAKQRGVKLGKPSKRLPMLEIERRVQAGETLREIAKTYKVSAATLSRRLNK